MATTIPPLPPHFNPAAEFPILNHYLFFNHAAVAPISARAAGALEKYAQESRDHAYLTGKWYRQAETVRQLAAKTVNADPAEIAFVKNTSEGLAFVANGLAWNPGDEVLSTAAEYPANVYPWMDLQQRLGVKHVIVPEIAGRIPLENLFAAVTPRTRLISVSHVEYASGYRNNLLALGEFCRDHNILLCVDAIQSAGVLPVDVRAMHIDFLSADGHKWLLGPEGLGFFFCAKKHLDANTLHPEIGWMNVINATNYADIDFTLRPDAKRFECGSYNIPGTLALGASLQLLHEISLPLVTQRTLSLTQLLEEGLKQKGYQIFSPRSTQEESSPILSFTKPNTDLQAVLKNLEAKKIILALRENRLRASPHFYQSPDHIHQLLKALP